ncbi:MAG: flippase-like domain-containing protein [Paracoccaceae bacterium]|nr:flippase-like domain-containing protein [Paracoccaceae bacterium]
MRWVIPICGALVAIGAIFLLYRDLNLARLAAALTGAKIGWIAVLGAAILLEHLIQGWKWRQLLFDLRPVSSLRLTGAVLAGYAANFAVPLGVSPLVRSWLVARLEGLRLATVLVTTAISRFIDGIVFAFFATAVAFSGRLPKVEGDLEIGLMVAGGLNLLLFATVLWGLYASRDRLSQEGPLISRALDWLARRGGGRLSGLRQAIAEGVVWPRARFRQFAIVGASVAMKLVASTHFAWAGLAVGVYLGLFDYLFLMIFAGFALILARFIRLPGGFAVGSAFALKLLDVPDEKAVAMILFSQSVSTILVAGIGFTVLWRNGMRVRSIRPAEPKPGAL